MIDFLVVVKNIEGVLRSSPSHVGSRGFAWILSLLTVCQYVLTVYLSFHWKKKVRTEKERKEKKNIGLSLDEKHPRPLCVQGRGLWATSDLFLFESLSQPSSLLTFSLPLTFRFVSTLSSPFPLPPRSHFLVLWKEVVKVCAVDLSKGSSKVPLQNEVRQQIPCGAS